MTNLKDIITKQCGCGPKEENIAFNNPYDSYYCKECDVWLDDETDVTDYMFGTPRPDKPSEGFQWVER